MISRRDYGAVKSEIGNRMVGHSEIVDGVLTCLFVGGHAASFEEQCRGWGRRR